MSACVLVVDDEPAILEVLRDVLELFGLKVVGAGRADLARTTAQSIHTDLFLIDVMLAGTSGIELARQLREDGHGQTPMVAMSASRAMTRFAQESGYFDDVIEKPFDISFLMQRLDRHLASAIS